MEAGEYGLYAYTINSTGIFFHSRVTFFGARPLTTDWILAMSSRENNNSRSTSSVQPAGEILPTSIYHGTWQPPCKSWNMSKSVRGFDRKNAPLLYSTCWWCKFDLWPKKCTHAAVKKPKDIDSIFIYGVYNVSISGYQGRYYVLITVHEYEVRT